MSSSCRPDRPRPVLERTEPHLPAVRLHVRVTGTVQGVGFRPFAHRTATARGLTGWVENTSGAVEIEVQGTPDAVDDFLTALSTRSPTACTLEHISTEVQPIDDSESNFSIRQSAQKGKAATAICPDLALCVDCRADIDDPTNLRYQYAFTSCTQCGPRYTVASAVPYDRARTTMREFEMCSVCRTEYEDPNDRRFHAESIACPRCGPSLKLLDETGTLVATNVAAIDAAARALCDGMIVGLRGLGGFQLLVDASSERAVLELRRRKRRDAKPFAVMFRDLEQLSRHAHLTDAERALLTSAEAPIVICERRGSRVRLASGIAPNVDTLGAMLPTTPLHHLLMQRVRTPLVCTSGNSSGEPMCTEFEEAISRLGHVAQLWLDHDRAIVVPLDDSVLSVSLDGPVMLRRARGYAPRSLGSIPTTQCVLALGAHLKNAIALAHAGKLVVSQHIGDLDHEGSIEAQRASVEALLRFHGAEPELIACDLHPDYASTRLAEDSSMRWGLPVVRVQHHHAHVAAVCAERGLTGPVVGLAWDGVGLGDDGELWGSEALFCNGADFRRLHHLQSFPLVGGERAIREPRRALLGVCHELGLALPDAAAAHFGRGELTTLQQMLDRNVNCPRSCGVGRLFDAVAALLGVRGVCSYEGQAAIELEALARKASAPKLDTHGAYSVEMGDESTSLRPLFEELLDDLHRGVTAAVVAQRVHATLVQWGILQLERFLSGTGGARAVVSGGCFQNRLLLDGIVMRTREMGIALERPMSLPANDGQIAAGQAWVAALAKTSPEGAKNAAATE